MFSNISNILITQRCEVTNQETCLLSIFKTNLYYFLYNFNFFKSDQRIIFTLRNYSLKLLGSSCWQVLHRGINFLTEEVALSASMQIIPASIRMYNDSSIIEAIVCFILYNYYYYCYYHKTKSMSLCTNFIS